MFLKILEHCSRHIGYFQQILLFVVCFFLNINNWSYFRKFGFEGAYLTLKLRWNCRWVAIKLFWFSKRLITICMRSASEYCPIFKISVFLVYLETKRRQYKIFWFKIWYLLLRHHVQIIGDRACRWSALCL